MLRRKSLSWPLLLITAASLPGVSWATSTVYVTDSTPATACVDKIRKGYVTNQTSPSTVFISKYLDMGRTCTRTASTNADLCDPVGPINANILLASAIGPNIAMNPFCGWTCAGCGNITISGNDGLPVELMKFDIE